MPPRLANGPFISSHHKTFSHPPISCCQCLRASQPRLFSSTPLYKTRQRRVMFRWLNGPGSVFRDPLPGSTNYLNAYDSNGFLIRLGNKQKDGGSVEDEFGGSSVLPGEAGARKDSSKNNVDGKDIPRESADDLIPFPLNKEFRSQPVLSEELKDEIFRRITQEGKSVKVVSAELGVDISRVGAVVRLKSVEQNWVEKGKPLAAPYARAVLAMLPTTPFRPNVRPTPHESINDLPVHSATLRQVFHPVSESRHFTRVDAGKVFDLNLLPADARIPHPELVEIEKLNSDGVQRTSEEKAEFMRAKMAQEQARKDARERKRTVDVTTVGNGRWDFRFQEVDIQVMGRDGRDHRGVGARYGVPAQDRKKSQVKIPRKVE